MLLQSARLKVPATFLSSGLNLSFMRIADIKHRVDLGKIRNADPALADTLERAWEHAEKLENDIQACDAPSALYDSWMTDQNRRIATRALRSARGLSPGEIVSASLELDDLFQFVTTAPKEFRESGCRCKREAR
jgi:hypothetical protein